MGNERFSYRELKLELMVKYLIYYSIMNSSLKIIIVNN